MEKDIPLQIKQAIIARKAIHGIRNMSNLRMTNKELKAAGLEPLTKTQFMKMLKGIPSECNRIVLQAQNSLRSNELPENICDELDDELKAKGGKSHD